MKDRVWIATMTEGEFSETAVYVLGVFDTREQAEAAVDIRIAERESEPNEYDRIVQMGAWVRSDCDSTRDSGNRYNARGEPASATVTKIETNAQMSMRVD